MFQALNNINDNVCDATLQNVSVMKCYVDKYCHIENPL